MTAGGIVALSVGGGVLLAILIVVFVVSLVRAGARSRAKLEDDILRSGERIVRGPERAVYSGGLPGTRVTGTGTLILTEKRLAFAGIAGGPVNVPLDTIVGLRTSRSFRYSSGSMHLILKTQNAEVGFVVTDWDAWIAAIRATAHLT